MRYFPFFAFVFQELLIPCCSAITRTSLLRQHAIVELV